MGSVNRRRNLFECGYLDLAYGQQTIDIAVDFRPSYVLTVIQYEYFPICKAPASSINIEVTDSGFEIDVDIQSQTAQVVWCAVWDPYYNPGVIAE